MSYESYSFTSFGDSKDEITRLYKEGWKLVTVATVFVFETPADRFTHTKDEKIYFYGVEYFFDRQIN